MNARSILNRRRLLPAAVVVAGLTLAIVGLTICQPGAVGASSAARPLQQGPIDVCTVFPSGRITTNTVWTSAAGRYIANTCSVRVEGGVSLTIEAGVTVELGELAAVQVYGHLAVTGDEPGSVTFTSAKAVQTAGDWPGVSVEEGGSASLRGLTLRYAGRGGNPAVRIREAGVVLDNVLIEDTADLGVYVDSVDTTLRRLTVQRAKLGAVRARQPRSGHITVELTDSTLVDNTGQAVLTDGNVQWVTSGNTVRDNTVNGIAITSGGTLVSPLTWSGGDMPYVIDTSLTVTSTLTLEAGAVIKFRPGWGMRVRGGTLVLNGTAERRVLFTAVSDDEACAGDPQKVTCDTNNDGSATRSDRGSWNNLDLESAAAPITLRHAEFRYGYASGRGVVWVRTPNVTIDRILVTHSRDDAVFIENVSATVVGSEFVDNRSTGNRTDVAGVMINNSSSTTEGRIITATLRDNLFADNDVAVSLRDPDIVLLNEGNRSDDTRPNGINGYLVDGNMDVIRRGGEAIRWRAADMPFIVERRIDLRQAVTLTLEAGLLVKMAGGANLETTSGTLRIGEAGAEPVLVTSLSDDACSPTQPSGCDTNGDGDNTGPSPGNWGTILIKPTSAGAVIRNTHVRYGGAGQSGTQLDIQHSAIVEDSEFSYGEGAGLKVYQVSPILARNRITSNRGAGIQIVSPPSGIVVELDANIIANNDGCAVDMDANVELELKGGNEATNNQLNGICVRGDSRVTRTWKAGTLPYLVTGDVNVVGESTLTLEPGAVVKFQGNAGLVVRERSAMIAQGTADRPVLFTSVYDSSAAAGGQSTRDSGTTPRANDWKGIVIDPLASGQIGSVLRHARILYTGYSSWPAIKVGRSNVTIEDCELREGNAPGIKVEDASPRIVGNTIVNMQGAGIEMRTLKLNSAEPVMQRNELRGCVQAAAMDASVQPDLEGNVAEENGVNGIVVRGSMIVNRRWEAGDLPFVLDGRVTVGDNTLRIDAGALVKADQGASLYIDQGRLEVPAAGSGDEVVTLTSLRDDTCGAGTGECDTSPADGNIPRPGDWEGVFVSTDAESVTFRNVYLAYAGSRDAAIVVDRAAFSEIQPMTIEDCLILYSGSNGIEIDDTAVVVRNSTLQGCLGNGVSMQGKDAITIEGNVFTDNGRSIEHRAEGTVVTRNNVAIGNEADPMLYCADVTSNQRWYNDLARDIDCSFEVKNGTLTLDPGLVLRFGERYGIDVSSEIQSEGATFTAAGETSEYGYWRSLRFYSQSRGTLLHNRFLFGGNGGNGVILSETANRLAIDFNTFRRIDLTAIGLQPKSAASAEVVGNLFRDVSTDRGSAVRVEENQNNPNIAYNRITSVTYAVQTGRGSRPTVRGNNLAGSVYGIMNRDVRQCIEAPQNWWGHAGGPTDRSIARDDACRLEDNPGGQGILVSDHVNYLNFLKQEPPQVPMLFGPRCGVTTQRTQTAAGSTTPGATVNVYDGASTTPEMPIASVEADRDGRFQLELDLEPGKVHKISFEAVQEGRRSAVSGFRLIDVRADGGAVDPHDLRFEYGTGATLRIQPLRDEAGCSTACGGPSSGRVTLPEDVPVRVRLPSDGSPTSVAFSQAGQPAQPMNYDGADRSFVSAYFQPVQGPFTIRVAGSRPTECLGYIFLGGGGVVYADIGSQGGQPAVAPNGDPFDYDFEHGRQDWSPSTPWDITTEKAHSGTHAWSDSPGGDYAPAAKVEIRSPGPIDLRTVAAPQLVFWHTYRFAAGDRGMVEIRTAEGASWQQLQVYNGTIGDWKGEVISLERFAREPRVWLRFYLSADSTSQDDGWYIDDVSIAPGGALNRQYDQGEPVVAGAQVRLEQLNLDNGEWVSWDGVPTGQQNPQFSDDRGRYGFYYLEPGEYQVVVTSRAGGVYRSPAQIVWNGTLEYDAPLTDSQPVYLPAVLRRRSLQ